MFSRSTTRTTGKEENMLYPTQITQIREFLEDLIRQYNQRLKTKEPIEIGCITVTGIMEEAQELRNMIANYGPMAWEPTVEARVL